jgi:hypothetical protein
LFLKSSFGRKVILEGPLLSSFGFQYNWLTSMEV